MDQSGGARARIRAALAVDALEQGTAAARIGAALFGASTAPDLGQLGPYLLLDRIGAGAHGVVWAAYHAPTRRRVACKVLGAGADHADAIAEARALAQVNHPNVVAVFDAGTDRGRSFIAMEWVTGQTLAAWLGGETRARREILAVFAAAARGLHAAHQVGVVHRDFKPGNVLVGADGRVRVGDFGLALAGGEAAGDRPPAGTPAYMAPELYRGGRADARSDQFAFFVALHEALVGRRPFTGADPAALCAAILGDDRTPMGLPAALARAVDRGLAPDPARRHVDMAAVAEWLDHASSGRGGRNRWPLAAAAIVVLGVALVGGAEPPRCEGPAAAAARLLPVERRAQVVAALDAAAPSAMVGVGDRVGRRFDDWTRRWAEIQHATCNAQVTGGAAVDDAMMCLRAAEREFVALGQVFADADATIARHAVEAAARLGPPDRCASAAAADAVVDDDVAAALAEVEALRTAGKPARALALAEATVDLVRTRGAAFDLVAAEVALGRAAEDAGEFDLAIEVLNAAFVDAYGIRADRLATIATTRLVYLEGYMLERGARGEYWYRTAASLQGGTAAARDSPEAADLLASIGAMAEARGDAGEALARTEAALHMRERLFTAPHPDLARAHNNVGVVLVGLERYDDAIAAHRRALTQRLALHGEQHPAVATSRHNLGFAYLRLGDHAAAERELTAALAIRSATLGDDHPDVASSLGAIASVLEARGDVEGARAALLRAAVIHGRVWGATHERTAAIATRIAGLGGGGAHHNGAPASDAAR